jgi:C4-dicarboxylate-specific signal transduction histidine kinase
MAIVSNDSVKARAGRRAKFSEGTLARIVRVDTRQVFRLTVLFSLWMLLALILLLAAQKWIASSPDLDNALLQQKAFWGGAILLLALAMSFGLAFSIARQHSLAMALEQAINTLPMQFAYIDDQRCYRFNNLAHQDSWADLNQDFSGRPVRESLGDEIYRQIEPYLERALAGERVDFELRLSGESVPSDLSVSYLPDIADGGQVKGLYVLCDDISKRKRVERRDKEQLLEFAELSRLASVGEVAAEIAHQINQPLAAIAMFSSAAQRTLADGGDQDKVRGWLETINGQSKRASDVIGSLRRFVRPGKLEPVALDLNAPLREVAALLTHHATARQVSLSLELEDRLPPVMAAGILIEQVAFNLLRAAIHSAADQATAGQVTIRSRADPERVWVEIISNGTAWGAYPDAEDRQSDEVSADACLGFSEAISRSIITGFDGQAGCRCHEGGTLCFFNLPRCEP